MGKFVKKIRLSKRSCGFKKSSGSAPSARAPQPSYHLLESSLTASYLGLKADKDLEGFCLPQSEGAQAWSLVDSLKTASKVRSEADLITARGVNLDTTCTAETQSLLATHTPSSKRTPHGGDRHSIPADKVVIQRRRRHARKVMKARIEYGRRLHMRTLAYV